MASDYTISDQAADLGIHRVHSLVLGDAKREARLARHSPPHFRRVELGRGDARVEDTQKEMLRERELEKIAKRNNLRMYRPSLPQMKLLIQYLVRIGVLLQEPVLIAEKTLDLKTKTALLTRLLLGEVSPSNNFE
jgi:hypothetical protein